MSSIKNSVEVFAPATVANVACGFDIFGFAVDAPGDIVRVSKTDKPGIKLTQILGDEGRLPKEPERNAVTVGMLSMLQTLGNDSFGAEVVLDKILPLGSGMGSSSASSVAGVFALNEILGRPFTKRELLPFAMEGEKAACGSAHADNVGPALLGGFVVVRSYQPLDVFSVHSPENLYCTLVHPDIEVNTKDARFILRNEVSLPNVIRQMGNVAGLVNGLATDDYALIGRSLEDVLIEPVRSLLIPQFHAVKQTALAHGALGCSISGAGPSLFALSEGRETAVRVGEAMQKAFEAGRIQSSVYVSTINQEGPKVLRFD